jgi:hypothetical protein
MILDYKEKKLMISKGLFEVGQYGRYKIRGEILHTSDSYFYGNNEGEVLDSLKDYIDKVDTKHYIDFSF